MLGDISCSPSHLVVQHFSHVSHFPLCHVLCILEQDVSHRQGEDHSACGGLDPVLLDLLQVGPRRACLHSSDI